MGDKAHSYSCEIVDRRLMFVSILLTACSRATISPADSPPILIATSETFNSPQQFICTPA